MAIMTKILVAAMAMVMMTLGVNGQINNEPSGAARRCNCTIHGDPHIQINDGTPFLLPIPCAHKIAQLVTPPEDGSCDLKINGRAEFANPHDLSGACYETLIHIRLGFEGYVFTLIFSKNNDPVHNITGAADLEAAGVDLEFVPGSDKFWRVTIDTCKMTFTYQPSKSSFTMSVPFGIVANEGICGMCDGGIGDISNPGRTAVFMINLNSLYAFSPIDNANINSYPICNSLTSIRESCTTEPRLFSDFLCAPLAIDADVRECIKPHLPAGSTLLDPFVHCVEAVCRAETTINCTAFFFDCAKEHTDAYCFS